MVEKWHHSRHDVILVVVTIWNLRIRVLRTRHAISPNFVLEFIDWSCDQRCDYARLYEDAEIVRGCHRDKCSFREVFRNQYFTFDCNHMLANEREVSSFGNCEVGCARVIRHPRRQVSESDCLRIATEKRLFIKLIITTCEGRGADIVVEINDSDSGHVILNVTGINNDEKVVLIKHVQDLCLGCVEWNVYFASYCHNVLADQRYVDKLWHTKVLTDAVVRHKGW